MARHAELQWHNQLAAQRHNMAPAYQGASLDQLYRQRAKRMRIRERQARLVVCGLFPALLALAVHMAW